MRERARRRELGRPGSPQPRSSRGDILVGARVALVEMPNHRHAYAATFAARARGAELTLVSSDPGAYTRTRRLERDPLEAFSRVVVADTTDPEAVVATMVAAGLAEHQSACLTFSAYHVEIAAKVSAALGLGTGNRDFVATVHNKQRLRKVLSGSPFEVRSVVLTDLENPAERAAAEALLPAIAKPVAAGGSIGTTAVDTMDELRSAFERISAIQTSARGMRLPLGVLLEERLIGPEYSVETLTIDSRTHVYGITSKRKHDIHQFTELGHAFPVLAGTATGERICTFVTDLLGFLGYTNGPAHTEVVLTADGPRLVEINPRVAGSDIPVLIEDVCESNPYLDALAVASGRTPAAGRPRQWSGVAFRLLVSRRAGRLIDVRGLDDARAALGVTSVECYTEPGADVRIPQDNTAYLGAVHARAQCAAEAYLRATAAADLISFNVA